MQPLAPIVDDIGFAVIEHGERGDLDPTHPTACLCGFDNYMLCPDYLNGAGVQSLTIGGTTDE